MPARTNSTIRTPAKRAKSSARNPSAQRLGGSIVRVPRTLGTGLPPKLSTTLRFVDTRANQISASFSTAVLLYSCVNMTQPRQPTGGGQPMLYDQLMALYSNYTVMKSRIKVSLCPILPHIGTGSSVFTFTLSYDDDGTPNAGSSADSIDFLLERPRAQNAQVAVGQTRVLSSTYSAAADFGVNALSNTALSGSVSTGPTEVRNWVIGVSRDETGTQESIPLLVEIEYDCVLNELVTASGS